MSNPPAVETFDYVIVGGGSAGCVLAARLSESVGNHVLLLEAGPRDRNPAIHVPAAFPTLFRSRIDWSFTTEPQAHLGARRVYWPRGKVLGGSSSINAMMWVRGVRADYERWSELAGPSWSYEVALNYFRRVEKIEDDARTADATNGVFAVSRQRDPNPLTLAWLVAAAECGVATGVPNVDEQGAFLTLVNQARGRRVSTADAYLRPALGRANLRVDTNALCTRITFEGRRATGVEYRVGRSNRTARARAEVIVCAGAVGSPTLLQRSGVGDAELLAKFGIRVVANRKQVGRNLKDHLTAGVVFATNQRVTLSRARSIGPLVQYALRRKGLLTSNVAEAYGLIRSNEALAAPDLELLFAPAAFLDEGLTLTRRHGISTGAVLLQPKSTGKVELSSTDPAIAPLIQPNYLSDEGGLDAATLEAGVRLALRIVRAPSFAGVASFPMQPLGTTDDELVDDAVHRFAQTLYHPVGTCAMGLDPHAVLDEALRVREVGGLRVIDASSIPHIIRGHTNAPTIMLAERGADLVRGTQTGDI